MGTKKITPKTLQAMKINHQYPIPRGLKKMKRKYFILRGDNAGILNEPEETFSRSRGDRECEIQDDYFLIIA